MEFHPQKCTVIHISRDYDYQKINTSSWIHYIVSQQWKVPRCHFKQQAKLDGTHQQHPSQTMQGARISVPQSPRM